MPVHYPSSSSSSSSKSRKSMGFSIDDLIKTDQTLPTARPLSSTPHLIPIPWIPPPSPNHLYHLHRQSLLEYFRCAHPYPHSEVATTALLLNSFRKPKRNRTAFTPAQLLKLEDAFEKNHYIVGEERKELARHLNLSETKVKVWYQNRRTKQKRLITEDANSSNNEINQQDESQTSDSSTSTTKHDGEDEDDEDEDEDDDDNQSEWNQDETSNQRLYQELSADKQK